MLSREDFVEWLEDNDGMVGNAELAVPLDESEGFVRAEGRKRNVRRVGNVMVWDFDSAISLFDDLVAEEEIEEEDDDLDDEGEDDEDDDLDFDPDEEDDEEE